MGRYARTATFGCIVEVEDFERRTELPAQAADKARKKMAKKKEEAAARLEADSGGKTLPDRVAARPIP